MTDQGLYDLFCDRLASLKLTPGQQLVVALGGGADSQTVLDLLMRYRETHPQYRYLAIHLDHHFHPSSREWSSIIQNAAQDYGVDTIFEPIEMTIAQRESKEAVGRDTRYQRMAELTDNQAVLLLGQHRNDQIETFFLQLKRGSGPKGLASMGAVQPWVGERRLCRPLLSVSKERIVEYATKQNLTWIEDDTNYDIRIERNYFRHKVIPLIEQRWPHFGDSVLRAGRLCAEQQQVMDELLAEKLRNAQETTASFPLTLLDDASAPMQRALLRAWLQALKYTLPSYEQLEQIRRQSLSAALDSQLQVRCGEYTVRYFKRALWCDNPVNDLPEEGDIHQEVIALGDLGMLRVPAALFARQSQLHLTFTLPPEKLAKPGRQGRKKLKDWLKQAGIPPWLRQRRPIVILNQQWVWVGDMGWFSYDPDDTAALPEPQWIR